MALRAPTFTQNDTTGQNAHELRQITDAFTRRSHGVVGPDDLKVTIVSGLNIRIASGIAVIPQERSSGAGQYVVHNDADIEIELTPQPSGIRRDLILLRVQDEYVGEGAGSLAEIVVIEGVTDVFANDPTIPGDYENYIILAHLLIATGLSLFDRRWTLAESQPENYYYGHFTKSGGTGGNVSNTNSMTQITGWATTFDPSDMYSSGTNFTIARPGLWLFHLSFSWTVNITGHAQAYAALRHTDGAQDYANAVSVAPGDNSLGRFSFPLWRYFPVTGGARLFISINAGSAQPVTDIQLTARWMGGIPSGRFTGVGIAEGI